MLNSSPASDNTACQADHNRQPASSCGVLLTCCCGRAVVIWALVLKHHCGKKVCGPNRRNGSCKRGKGPRGLAKQADHHAVPSHRPAAAQLATAEQGINVPDCLYKLHISGTPCREARTQRVRQSRHGCLSFSCLRASITARNACCTILERGTTLPPAMCGQEGGGRCHTGGGACGQRRWSAGGTAASSCTAGAWPSQHPACVPSSCSSRNCCPPRKFCI